MEYKCQLKPVNQLIPSYSGFVMPLCEKCRTEDCTNPIELKKISILGVTKKIKVYSKGTDISFVISCEGFLNKWRKKNILRMIF